MCCLCKMLGAVFRSSSPANENVQACPEGGTAKTTTAAAVGLLLARAGRPVHLVDMDPQASLTRAFGQNDAADRQPVAWTRETGHKRISSCGPDLAASKCSPKAAFSTMHSCSSPLTASSASDRLPPLDLQNCSTRRAASPAASAPR